MGLGLLWILYAGWWSGMRVIFILQFLCVMSGIYWHLTRRGAHCAPANLRQYRIILSADTASEVRQLLGQKRRETESS